MKVSIEKKVNEKLANKLKKMIDDSKKELRVGFLEGSYYPDSDKTTAEVAALNEYGHEEVPPRPFMKQTIDANNKKWMEIFEKKLKDFDYNIEKTLNFLGLIAMGNVKETILKGNFAPLSAETIKKKGHSKPLIDTTHMLNSVEYEIKNKGE